MTTNTTTTNFSVNSLLSYAGWTFLPNLVTGWLQAIYYGIMIRAGDPKPQPGTPVYNKHRRRIHVAVVLVYLLYTIYEADYWMRREGDFYQLLGVTHWADEKIIKSRFRRLAALHHPDKIASVFGGKDDGGAADAYYVRLKNAQDILTTPAKRFAYERFGPDVMHWQHVTTIKEYLWTGLAGITTHPPLLPFQLLILARKTFLTLCIALSQLQSFFASPMPPTTSTGIDPQQLARLEQMAKGSDIEAARLLALEMAPFVGDESAVKELRGRIRDWLVQNTIRADPLVRDAVGKALGRRRVGAPPGARNSSQM
ncbi:MAG: hypothetical protein Q9191_002663 [Dirinaria sp. TL-2023a]